ncbi:thioredoxin [Thiolapillus brandeum]|uniref:Thioredoxin n=1 Tax=Thiolapillus brandeum TaxID=1076588 RepID=A0A7U6GJC8_9GAMM|nr:thioredoxin [Thiolapillus brandeum]BAO44638.1 thioredoxin [Thiolapillus brandeum]
MSNSPYIIEITEDNYQAFVIEQSRQVPVLVDFWASWCQPCQMLMPVLARLAEDYQGKFILAKINTEEQQTLASQFGIRSIPTVKLFKNGEPVDEFAGALPEAEIRKFLDRHIPRESDALVDQALQLLQQGEGKSALELLEQAKTADPANDNINLALARIQAALGDPVSAEKILLQLPADMRDKPEVQALAGRLFFESLLMDAPSQTELMQRLEADGHDAEAMYLLAAHHVKDQNYEQAVDLLLQLMKKDRSWGDGAARTALLKLFDVLGDDPVVPRYRSKMMSLIY